MEAVAIKLINEGADNYFIGNAQVLRKLKLWITYIKS